MSETWAENLEFPVADWQYAVMNGDTRRSYREWVEIESGQEDEKSKTLIVTCVCEATVTETWTLTVPDDYEPPPVDEFDMNTLLGLSDVGFVDCAEAVDNEHDRDVVGWEWKA